MQNERKTLSKNERLKSRKLITNLFSNGFVLDNFPFKVVYILSDIKDFQHPAKMAVSVTKKNFKRAVDRNYIKRKIKEAYRKSKTELYNYLEANNQKVYFIVIYTAKEDLNIQQIESNMKNMIKKLMQKLDSFNVKKS